jgi:hypothetical protein
MEIDTRRMKERKPFKDLIGWRDKLDPKDEKIRSIIWK